MDDEIAQAIERMKAKLTKERAKMEKFWMVARQGGGGPPLKRHPTKLAAMTEAARLAQLHSDGFFILECIGIVKPMELPINYTEFSKEEA